MSKKPSAEIYTADCSYIEKLHGILQKANLVVMILEILSVIGMIAAEVFEEIFILVPVIIAVVVLLYLLNKLVINVSFGFLYDVRVTRMNTTPADNNAQDA